MESQHLLYTTSTVPDKVRRRNQGQREGAGPLHGDDRGHRHGTRIPCLGYEKATELAKRPTRAERESSRSSGRRKVLTEAQIKDLLDPVKLTNLDKSKYQTTDRISSRLPTQRTKTPSSRKMRVPRNRLTSGD